MKHFSSRYLPVLSMVLALCGVGVGVDDAAAAGAGISAFACGDLRPPGQYGPFDYRSAPPDVRHRVEDYHFTAEVESAKKGATGAAAGPDIDYTLRAFPNNARALLAVSRYVSLTKSERPPGLRFVAECYYERAIRFTPDDPMPHLMYAVYLSQRKRMGEVRAELDAAERVRGEPTNFDFDYNLGLLYLDVGAYDEALKAAKRAYALGAPMAGLQRKLQAAGKWRDDPAPLPVAPPAPGDAVKAEPDAKVDADRDAGAPAPVR